MNFADKWHDGLNIKTVILPIGSMEAHGTHLPFNTDTIIPEKIAEAAASKTKAFMLPALPYGNTQRSFNFKGSVGILARILSDITAEILESAISQGAENIIVFNGHDGNQPSLEVAVRDVVARNDAKIKIIIKSWWDLISPEMAEKLNIKFPLGHAGKEETSFMMYLKPDEVVLNKTIEQSFVKTSNITKYYFNDRKIPYEGRPMDASRELGKKLFDSTVDALVDLINK